MDEIMTRPKIVLLTDERSRRTMISWLVQKLDEASDDVDDSVHVARRDTYAQALARLDAHTLEVTVDVMRYVMRDPETPQADVGPLRERFMRAIAVMRGKAS